MAKTKIVLKNRMKNGEYRLFIRVSHLNYPAKYFKLPYSAHDNEWDKIHERFTTNKPESIRLNEQIDQIKTKLKEVVNAYLPEEDFSYEELWVRYNSLKQPSVGVTLNSVFVRKLDELKFTNRYGSYRTYSNCYASLSKYASLEIEFADICYKFLKGFENYHINIGNKPNTYGGYFRIMRAIHYEHCKLNDLPEPNIYKRFNIARIKNEARKKSLNRQQLKDLIEFEPPSGAQVSAKQIFLFSFYVRGINLMDMLQLTDKNLEGDVLVYRRQKTGKQMQIKLVSQAMDILRYFQNDSPYLFPYMREGDIPKYRISDVNRNINRRLKLIGDEIGIKQITMYSARHTFAELQYKSGVRIEIISQMLGHSDLKTTQTYLRSFSDDEVDDAAAKVFDSLK
jgi:integrase